MNHPDVTLEPFVNSSAQLLAGPPTSTPVPAQAPPVRPSVLLAVLGLAGTVFALMQALVIPALPLIQASLRTNADGAAWISTAYSPRPRYSCSSARCPGCCTAGSARGLS
jgi:hypothetical protein